MGYLEEGGCGVATDGSLYNVSDARTLLSNAKPWQAANQGEYFQKYPKFPERIHEALVDIFGEKGRTIHTYHAEDGSGVGAAIIAGKHQLSCIYH